MYHTQIRTSDSMLAMYRGRCNKTALANIICPLCHKEVEDECHFFITCKNLINLRLNCLMTFLILYTFLIKRK